jgi:hypothetical protein
LTKTMVGIQFGRLFHELIWSPWNWLNTWNQFKARLKSWLEARIPGGNALKKIMEKVTCHL